MKNQLIHNGKVNISAYYIKLAAVVSMFADHFAASLLRLGIIRWDFDIISRAEMYTMIRSFGRFAFPVFCFFIAEGFVYTKDAKKYMRRLLGFAFISEIPFDMAINGKILEFGHQNVYFTLFLGLLAIYLLDKFPENTIKSSVLRLCIMAGCLGAAYLLKTDYKHVGVALIIFMYLARKYRILQVIAGVFLMYSEFQNVYIILPIAVFFLMLMAYNGKRGRSFKYFFYVFYPAHLFVLGAIRLLW